METPPEKTPPAGTKRSFLWTYFVLTPVIVVLMYVLSAGPVFMLASKGVISQKNQFIFSFYEPFGWAYEKTPLRKPLGIYWHLWVPEHYDKNGEVIPVTFERVNPCDPFVNALPFAARPYTA